MLVPLLLDQGVWLSGGRTRRPPCWAGCLQFLEVPGLAVRLSLNEGCRKLSLSLHKIEVSESLCARNLRAKEIRLDGDFVALNFSSLDQYHNAILRKRSIIQRRKPWPRLDTRMGRDKRTRKLAATLGHPRVAETLITMEPTQPFTSVRVIARMNKRIERQSNLTIPF